MRLLELFVAVFLAGAALCVIGALSTHVAVLLRYLTHPQVVKFFGPFRGATSHTRLKAIQSSNNPASRWRRLNLKLIACYDTSAELQEAAVSRIDSIEDLESIVRQGKHYHGRLVALKKVIPMRWTATVVICQSQGDTYDQIRNLIGYDVNDQHSDYGQSDEKKLYLAVSSEINAAIRPRSKLDSERDKLRAEHLAWKLQRSAETAKENMPLYNALQKAGLWMCKTCGNWVRPVCAGSYQRTMDNDMVDSGSVYGCPKCFRKDHAYGAFEEEWVVLSKLNTSAGKSAAKEALNYSR